MNSWNMHHKLWEEYHVYQHLVEIQSYKQQTKNLI